jgi:hypothetical protein
MLLINSLSNIFSYIQNIHNEYDMNSERLEFKIYEILFSFFFIYIFDYSLYLLKDRDKKRRWYFIHAVVNTYITIMSFHDFLFVLFNPLKSLDGSHISSPLMTTISLHFFHIFTSYKSLTIVDWLHHIVSCIFVGLLGGFYVKGPLVNYYLFFLCGLPGGIDYYLLTLTKYNIIYRLTEKKINVELNMWIRLPGILFGCFTSYMCILYNNTLNYNIYLSILVIFLNMYNSIYFATLVVKNYGLHLEKLTKKNLVKTIKKNLSNCDLKKLE